MRHWGSGKQGQDISTHESRNSSDYPVLRKVCSAAVDQRSKVVESYSRIDVLVVLETLPHSVQHQIDRTLESFGSAVVSEKEEKDGTNKDTGNALAEVNVQSDDSSNLFMYEPERTVHESVNKWHLELIVVVVSFPS
jgi:nucleoid DNA-binding protein